MLRHVWYGGSVWRYRNFVRAMRSLVLSQRLNRYGDSVCGAQIGTERASVVPGGQSGLRFAAAPTGPPESIALSAKLVQRCTAAAVFCI